MQRLKREIILSLRQRVKIFAADKMRLRYMLAQDSTFRRQNSEVLVPIGQRQPFQQPLVAPRRIGEGIGRNIDGTSAIGAAQRRKTTSLPEKIGRAVDNESHCLLPITQALAVPAKLVGEYDLGTQPTLAQQLNEKLELASKFALLQRLGIIEHEMQVCRIFAKEGFGLPLHQGGDVLLEGRQAPRRRNLLLSSKFCGVMVERIDDGCEQEARPVVVDLDELEAAPREKKK